MFLAVNVISYIKTEKIVESQRLQCYIVSFIKGSYRELQFE